MTCLCEYPFCAEGSLRDSIKNFIEIQEDYINWLPLDQPGGLPCCKRKSDLKSRFPQKALLAVTSDCAALQVFFNMH